MRPIKFRAYYERSKKYLECSICNKKDHRVFNAYYGICQHVIYSPASPPILELFTGLLDKNNKEIFEGDVVKGNSKRFPDEFSIGLICWDEKEAGFMAHWQDDDSRGGISEFFSVLEIIGNATENPELQEK